LTLDGGFLVALTFDFVVKLLDCISAAEEKHIAGLVGFG
jgi:hypothetical protein